MRKPVKSNATPTQSEQIPDEEWAGVLIQFPKKTYRLLQVLARDQGVEPFQLCYLATLEYLLENLEMIPLPVETYRSLECYAAIRGVDLNDVSCNAIVEYIKTHSSPIEK